MIINLIGYQIFKEPTGRLLIIDLITRPKLVISSVGWFFNMRTSNPSFHTQIYFQLSKVLQVQGSAPFFICLNNQVPMLSLPLTLLKP